MTTATFTPVASRFVWKEYRMLRAFWAAVAVLAVIEQWVATLLAAPGSDLPAWLFGSALAAATLYAAGAAATSFAVEHEEETYGYLAGLPAKWLPGLAGKVFVSLASAVALAAVLAVTGWTLAGGRWPLATDVKNLLGMLGVAIVEAVAWGTLFSLVVRRPLVAALPTLVIGILATHLAVNASGSSPVASLQMHAYSEAIPLRLAVVATLLVCIVLLARRWLPTSPRHSATPSTPTLAAIRAALSRWLAPAACVFASLRNRPPRRSMLARLVWQTWRESWKLILLLPAAALLLPLVCLPIFFPTSQGFDSDVFEAGFALLGACFFLPGLFGAMAFHADQRRGSHRFLAEHAARPRYVWLARHVVWLGALAVVLVVIAIAAAIVAAGRLEDVARHSRELLLWPGVSPPGLLASWLRTIVRGVLSGGPLLGFGALAAYALGQLCSMLLRSGVLAAFLALVLAVVLSAWVAVLFVWQLSGWLFLVPLAAGLLAATWLRAPGWIVGRNSWRHWIGPALAIAAPLVLLSIALPAARLAQLPADPFAPPAPDAKAAEQNQRVARVVRELDAHGFPTKRFTADQLETARMYSRAYELMWSWREKGIVPDDAPADERATYDEATKRLQELHEQDPEAATFITFEAIRRCYRQVEAEATQTADMYLQIARRLDSEIENSPLEPWLKEFPVLEELGADVGVAKQFLPPDRLDAFVAAYRQTQLMKNEVRLAALDDLIAVSHRPWCQFPVQEADQVSPEYLQLTELATSVTYVYDTPTARARPTLDRLLAGLRMCDHLREGQPALAFMFRLRTERTILKSIAQWAADDQRTSDELHDALHRLQAHFRSWSFKTCSRPFQYRFVDGKMVGINDQIMRGGVEGQQLPLILASKYVTSADWLAWLANRLPWERQRALRALDLISSQNDDDANRLLSVLAERTVRREDLGRWLRPSAYRHDWPPEWIDQQPAAATSWLVRLEYEARVPIYELYRELCDTELARRATLLQIALIAYRRDHDRYPSHLADLVPDYFDKLPLDPYSGQPFRYAPAGLDLPLLNCHEYLDRPADTVAPETPLFWSIGPYDARLTRREVSYDRPDKEKPDTESTVVRETIYQLAVRRDYWYYWSSWDYLIFPLPK